MISSVPDPKLGAMNKTCTKCGEEKPSASFHRDSSGADGFRAQCKVCRGALVKAWYDRTKPIRNEKDRNRDPGQQERRRAAGRELYKRDMASNPAKRRDPNRVAANRYRQANPEVQLRIDLRRRNGLTLEEYTEMVEKQGGVCAICGTKPSDHRLAVDHCHKTNEVRGLLCRKCNVGIGNLDDDVSRVFAAAAYLIEHEDVLEVITR